MTNNIETILNENARLEKENAELRQAIKDAIYCIEEDIHNNGLEILKKALEGTAKEPFSDEKRSRNAKPEGSK